MEDESLSPALAIHGGAGAFRVTSNRSLSRYREGLFRACEAGYTRLLGSNALEAVEASIRWMEDSGLFNAGIGSHLTLGGKVEMDAAIMDGRTLQAGAVGAVPCVKNPISLARRVMEETDHVLLVGEGALRFSRLLGLEETDEFLTEEKLKRHEAVKESWSKGEAYTWLRRLPQLTKRFPQLLGTVGAVAVDERRDLWETKQPEAIGLSWRAGWRTRRSWGPGCTPTIFVAPPQLPAWVRLSSNSRCLRRSAAKCGRVWRPRMHVPLR